MSLLENNSFAALRSLGKRKSSAVPESAAVELPPEPQTDKRPKIKIISPPMQQMTQSTFIPSANNVQLSSDRRAMVLIMNRGDTLYFQGQAHIVAIQGSVEIYGRTLHGQGIQTDTEWTLWPCFSPKGFPALFIQALTVDENHRKGCVNGSLLSESERVSLRNLIPMEISTDSIVVGLLELCFSGSLGFETLSPAFRGIFSDVGVDSRIGLKGLEFIGVEKPPELETRTLNIPESWKNGVNRLTENNNTGPLVISVLGAKDSGKSTCARYTVNRLLSRYPKVAYLDCDVGQAEFTPPGFVSLSYIEFPLFGPSFTHLIQPHSSLFIGSTSPKHDPDYYLACVMELWRRFKSSGSSGIPLIVNTQGWIKGMGYDLLSAFLTHVQPSHILHILSLDGRPSVFSPILENLQSVSVIDLESPFTLNYRPKFNASDHRLLSLASYFLKNPSLTKGNTLTWNFSSSLGSQTPYRVPWESVRLHFQAYEIPPFQILYALNGSTIGLISDRTLYESSKVSEPVDETNPFSKLSLVPSHLPLSPSQHTCVGLGIIQSIDTSNGYFYILTPVNPSLLSSVNLLVKGPGHGGIETPVALRMQGFMTSGSSIESSVPYTTYFFMEGLGAASKKTRHLQRKRDFQ